MSVKIDHATAWAYLESYKSFIQSMHPLIPPQDLDNMVGEFLQKKQSESALVLLVFSLGSLCLWMNKRHLYNHKSNRIPGYQYFIHATRLLRADFGRNGLNFIRAHILASLYCDQLGQVTDSFRHIRLAGAETLDRLLPHIDRLTGRGEGPGPDAEPPDPNETELLIAFWSCWQVESDLLTDQHFSPSGVLDFDEIRFPDRSALQKLGFSAAVVTSYAAHIHLRKQTNKICRLLHNPEKYLDAQEMDQIIMEFEKELMGSRWQITDLANNSGDPMDLTLLARIYKRFWEAKVIAYCPWLKAALDLPPNIPPRIMENTEKCIDAMLKSTMAFHNLEKRRSTITNVVGTAHFQFGNLVALTTVLDSRLTQLIDKVALRNSLKKTIQVLEVMAQNISGLALDLKVLQRLEREMSGHDHTSEEPRRRETG